MVSTGKFYASILLLSTVYISFCYGLDGEITQWNLNEINDPQYIDVMAIVKILSKSWSPEYSTKPYSSEIHGGFVFNQKYASLNRTVPNNYEKQRAEIALNKLADDYHDYVVLTSKNFATVGEGIQTLQDRFMSKEKQLGWFELRQAILDQHRQNLSGIVYNEIQANWTVCAWVENWKRSRFPQLTEVLAPAPDYLRVCCMHYLLGEPPIYRKPKFLLDYIPLEFLYLINSERFGAGFETKRNVNSFSLKMLESHKKSKELGMRSLRIKSIDNEEESDRSYYLHDTGLNDDIGKDNSIMLDDSTIRFDLNYVFNLFDDSDWYQTNCLQNTQLSDQCFSYCCASSQATTSACRDSTMTCA